MSSISATNSFFNSRSASENFNRTPFFRHFQSSFFILLFLFKFFLCTFFDLALTSNFLSLLSCLSICNFSYRKHLCCLFRCCIISHFSMFLFLIFCVRLSTAFINVIILVCFFYNSIDTWLQLIFNFSMLFWYFLVLFFLLIFHQHCCVSLCLSYYNLKMFQLNFIWI